MVLLILGLTLLGGGLVAAGYYGRWLFNRYQRYRLMYLVWRLQQRQQQRRLLAAAAAV